MAAIQKIGIPIKKSLPKAFLETINSSKSVFGIFEPIAGYLQTKSQDGILT